MEPIASQFLRAVRGRRSQVAFSRRLGYRGNPVADWEAGRRFPTATETLRVCTVAGIDIHAAFERFHPGTAQHIDTTDEAVAAWLSAHRGSTQIGELAARTGASRYAVSRWLTAGARPRLPDFLRLIEALTGRMPALVGELIPLGAVPILAERQRARLAAHRLAFDEPWTAAVLRVLETEGYRQHDAHPPGYIADVLRLPISTERRCLDSLERCGVVEMREGLYVPIAQLSVATRAEPAETRALAAHWTEVSLARQRARRIDGDLFSYNIFSVSHDDLDRIRELHRAYFRDVRAIVAASESEQTVAMINLHLMEWREPEA